MQTSNFARYGEHPNAVAISRSVPKWFRGKVYKPLAPPWKLIMLGKSGDKEEYTRQYKAQLAELDPRKVYEELGEDAVLLCYEKPGDFCHRRLVAEWLERNLGIEVPEYNGE